MWVVGAFMALIID